VGGEIEDEWDCRGVGAAEAHEHPAARAWLPARDFLSILETRIKDVGRATPDMEVDEALAWDLSACHNVDGSNSGDAVGAVVVDEYGIVNGHRPV
jgi:hypothetical protein